MVNQMNEISNKVGELVDLIKQSDDYQEYISLMNIMKEDKDINFLIKEIKDSQKKIMKLKQQKIIVNLKQRQK